MTEGSTKTSSRDIDLRRLTSERLILKSLIDEGKPLETQVSTVSGKSERDNTVGEEVLGIFRPPTARKAVIADIALLEAFKKEVLETPTFLEAGPREHLLYDPQGVRVAIVTTGGLAPGLHSVIHSVVRRHCKIYGLGQAQGKIFGVYDSFKGLCNLADNLVVLSPSTTEEWLDYGGSKLGIVRYYYEERQDEEATNQMVDIISGNLRDNYIDILYVIGGDGSLRVAHKIASKNPERSIVGIPKTMDNDVLWVGRSFGFDTAVEQATRVINVLHREAESTRRICLIELFGAESGFVAANASLASGHVDLVLIPEVFHLLEADEAQTYLQSTIEYIRRTYRTQRTEHQEEHHNPHAVVVVAEGVGTVLEKKGVSVEGQTVNKDKFVDQFADAIRRKMEDARGHLVFVNQPRHHIRAVPTNPHDQIYCERLGALAVDNALAGYTDFMISHWLSEFVLVPLRLVEKQKSIPVNGMFWKQVTSSTGQPLSPAEYPTELDKEFWPL
jgi:6-phosphofructokinase 1